MILVTGCSSGIGLALAKSLYTMSDYRVAITTREKSLKELQEKFEESDRFAIIPLDVTSSKSREEAVLSICARWGTVNILINNAGISYRSVTEHMDAESEFLQMQTNYLGPMGLIRLVLPVMRDMGRGKIINVSSVSGMLAMPTMSSYSASKHALEGASEALWYEMKPLGINVTLVQPGFIRSLSFEKVCYSPKAELCIQNQGDAYTDYYRHMTPFIAKMMKNSLTTPEHVAQKIIHKVVQKENPPLRVPVTLDAFFFYYLRRWLPRRLFHPFLFWNLPGAKSWAAKYSRRRGL